jgi:hypothetical protein
MFPNFSTNKLYRHHLAYFLDLQFQIRYPEGVIFRSSSYPEGVIFMTKGEKDLFHVIDWLTYMRDTCYYLQKHVITKMYKILQDDS